MSSATAPTASRKELDARWPTQYAVVCLPVRIYRLALRRLLAKPVSSGDTGPLSQQSLQPAFGPEVDERGLASPVVQHWLSKSVGPVEIQAAVARVKLWRPLVRGLLVVTSGRFTTDAVAYADGCGWLLHALTPPSSTAASAVVRSDRRVGCIRQSLSVADGCGDADRCCGP